MATGYPRKYIVPEVHGGSRSRLHAVSFLHLRTRPFLLNVSVTSSALSATMEKGGVFAFYNRSQVKQKIYSSSHNSWKASMRSSRMLLRDSRTVSGKIGMRTIVDQPRASFRILRHASTSTSLWVALPAALRWQSFFMGRRRGLAS